MGFNMVILMVTKETKQFKPQGEVKSLTSQKYSTQKVVRNGRDVSMFAQNVYLAQQLDNLETQLFCSEPDVSVLDATGNEHEELTIRFKNMFLKAGLERSMHVTFYEYMLYGCSVKTLGISLEGDIINLTEIRDLPADTFWNAPDKKTNYETPNPLMAGLTVDKKTGALEAQQCVGTNNDRIEIDKFWIFKEPSAPEPFGQAYCLPLYPIVAQIDEADKAVSSLMNRVAAPIIFFKMTDDSRENPEILNRWGAAALQGWGKKSAFMIPRGVEILAPNIYESNCAMERLESLKKVIAGFFNPTIVLQRAETGLGGSDTGAQQIYYNFLEYTQRWVSHCYEEIADRILALSGFDGFTCNISLKNAQPPNVNQIMSELNLLHNSGAITVDELRRNCKSLELDEEFVKDEPEEQPEQPEEGSEEGSEESSEEESKEESEEKPEEESEEESEEDKKKKKKKAKKVKADNPKKVEKENKKAMDNVKADAIDIVNANTINDILKMMRD